MALAAKTLDLPVDGAQQWLWQEWRHGRVRVFEADGTQRVPPASGIGTQGAQKNTRQLFDIDALRRALSPEGMAEAQAARQRDHETMWDLGMLNSRLGRKSPAKTTGRPTKISPDALVELGAWLHASGLPDELSTVERRLADLCGARGTEMADSSIRRWAKLVLAAHRRALEAEKSSGRF
jgi:hypothetical protein